MGSGFLIAKAVAVYTGPGGMAMLGQVQSFVSALNGIVAAPAGSGVVRYTAEHHQEGFEACAHWWKASVRWLLGLLALVIPLTLLAATPLANWMFGHTAYAWLVVIAALALPFSTANTLIASVINGQQQYKRYVGLGMVSVLIATGVMLVMIVTYRLEGALFAAVVFSALSGCVMLAAAICQPWFKLRYWWGRVDRNTLKGIGGYVAMAISSAVCAPVSLILVRNIIVESVGWAQAGHWQAVYKISEVYLGVITMSLSTYYLPRLSAIRGSDKILAEVCSVAKVVMPIVVGLAIAVFATRDLAIILLFTEKFRPARDLFSVQLIGDVIKILSWLLAFPMLARGAARWFVGTEILFSLSFTVLALIFVPTYGAQGANLAYTFNYVLYATFLFINFKRIIN